MEARNLSYGQQKLLELAGVLMGDPDTIMLDEPAGGVNPALIGRIGTLVQELNAEGRTFLVVEHNMEMVMSLSHHVIVFDRGRPIAEGTPPSCSPTPSPGGLPWCLSRPRNGVQQEYLLELDDIQAGYGRAAMVLRGLTIKVPASTVVCLVGPNGAGKSTVLKVASGLLKPRSGRVVVGGRTSRARARRRCSRPDWRTCSRGTASSAR
ncbi:ATP-binding cassette domain-containing protein [Oerskovia sp. M15]